ncbi:exonuclease/endonuclease/phosphatase family protein [Piscirickettsia litoralis]|uniref:hypothetical protein n=1 Tax=Piscirickettsia litoralis TaxID=1891921 RepID=UPI001112E119|nr:hypothetical protein [Piscirickettsia litoralis]
MNNKSPYDFISLEAYPVDQHNREGQSEKDVIASVVGDGDYKLIGNGRSGGHGEATPIMYNNANWHSVTDADLERKIQSNCSKYDSQSGHGLADQTCSLGSYNQDAPFGKPHRIATWGVFQSASQPSQKIIYVVSHFPVGGGGPDGYEFGRRIDETIINPLREEYKGAPVVLSADFNGAMPDAYDKVGLNPFVAGATIAAPDNWIKIHYIPSYNQSIRLSELGQYQLIPTHTRDINYECENGANPACLSDHHDNMIDATFSFSGSGPSLPCPTPDEPTVSGQSGAAMQISWSKVKGATSYKVYGYPGKSNLIGTTSDTRYPDASTVGKAGPFDYYVQALCNSGASELSHVNHYIPPKKSSFSGIHW